MWLIMRFHFLQFQTLVNGGAGCRVVLAEFVIDDTKSLDSAPYFRVCMNV